MSQVDTRLEEVAQKICELFDSFASEDVRLVAGELAEYRKEVLREAAAVAINEKVDYDATGQEADAAYNLACSHIAYALEHLAKGEQP